MKNEKSGTRELLARRKAFSKKKFRTLGAKLNRLAELQKFPDLTIYATGSYARNEASEHSDIDLFFLCPGSARREGTRLDEMRLFAKVIEIGAELELPTFSNDGEFLKFLYVDDMLMRLGGREDDYHNYFTARMLLLLESKPLVNAPVYDRLVARIINAYLRDYPDHPKNFRPVFLINDVLRFWKTICLNYEHRRNKPTANPLLKRKQQIKNFKLKFSRLITCFGTVAAICARPKGLGPKRLRDLTAQTPLERLRAATQGLPAKGAMIKIESDYGWFLEQTGLSTNELHRRFGSSQDRKKMFARADAFGERVFNLVWTLAKKNDYERYLVI